jgi:hypothetical protein
MVLAPREGMETYYCTSKITANNEIKNKPQLERQPATSIQKLLGTVLSYYGNLVEVGQQTGAIVYVRCLEDGPNAPFFAADPDVLCVPNMYDFVDLLDENKNQSNK